jgi:hypothetical protein
MPDENLQSLPPMSGNHRRVLSIRFRLLEEYCLRLMDLFQGSDTIFISRRALPGHKAHEIGAGVRELRALMAQVKSDLGLETRNEDGAREAAALVAAMTTSVEELHPHALKGYGALPGPTAAYLEKRLADLHKVMKRIEHSLGKPEGTGKPGE